MAIISQPNPGQPIDTSFISNIVTAINELSEEIIPSSTKYVNIDTRTAGKQNVSIAETKIIAGYIEVANNQRVDAGTEKEFSYSFPADFRYEPIVLATPIAIGTGSPSDRNVIVTIKSVANSRVDGIVRFNESSAASVGINLLIIGVAT